MTAPVKPAKKLPVTAQKDTTLVYMVDNTDAQVDAVNESYWRTQRVRVCACAVVLTTLIVVAGALVTTAIVFTHTRGVTTTEPQTNRDREPLLGNEVPLPKLPEVTIRIKIDDGELLPPAEPTTPGIIAIDDVTDDITDPLPSISLSSSSSSDSSVFEERSFDRRTYVSSSYPYDGYYANGQVGIPPWEQSNWIGPSEQARLDEANAEVSGDDQEGSGEPDPAMTAEPAMGEDESSDSVGMPELSLSISESSSNSFNWISSPVGYSSDRSS